MTLEEYTKTLAQRDFRVAKRVVREWAAELAHHEPNYAMEYTTLELYERLCNNAGPHIHVPIELMLEELSK